MPNAVASTDALTIAPLPIEKLKACIPFAQRFHAEMKLPGKLLETVWLKNWTTFLSSYNAEIHALYKGEELIGGLGGMIVPDLLDGRLCAHEMFWFMHPDHRVGTGAIRLLKHFEQWAQRHDASEVRMVHLVGNHDEQLKRIYEKMGYRCLEMCYRKPLSPLDTKE